MPRHLDEILSPSDLEVAAWIPCVRCTLPAPLNRHGFCGFCTFEMTGERIPLIPLALIYAVEVALELHTFTERAHGRGPHMQPRQPGRFLLDW